MIEAAYCGNNNTTGIKTMPFIRRRRQHLSSARTNQVEVYGTTYLCFPVDQSWFQGNINTDDESSYSLYGERVSSDPTIEIEQKGKSKDGDNNNNNGNELAEGNNETSAGDLSKNLEQDYYRVTLTDHFTGLSYHLPKIGVNPKSTSTELSCNNGHELEFEKDTNLFNCSEAEVKFKVENIYKGQKADMVIQKCLGSSSLLGQKCLVYSGPISIVFEEVIENGRSWCL